MEALETKIMAEVAEGNLSAFRTLVELHHKSLISFIARFTGDRDSAEDIAQEVFLRVFKAAKDYKPQAGIFLTEGLGLVLRKTWAEYFTIIVTGSPNGKVARIAQSPDSDGLRGELDQPGEPIIWQGRLVVTCFDLVVNPQNVNTRHETPATLSELTPG